MKMHSTHGEDAAQSTLLPELVPKAHGQRREAGATGPGCAGTDRPAIRTPLWTTGRTSPCNSACDLRRGGSSACFPETGAVCIFPTQLCGQNQLFSKAGSDRTLREVLPSLSLPAAVPCTCGDPRTPRRPAQWAGPPPCQKAAGTWSRRGPLLTGVLRLKHGP